MFLKSQFKASTLCASSALLVLGGFMSINLAGCGGGGGGNGGTFASATATPASQAITFRLVRQNLTASNGGTVTLTSSTGTVFNATAASTGIATVANVPPGTYTVVFTVVDNAGATISTTTSTVIVTRLAGQTYLLLQDQGTGSVGAFTVSGTIRLNPGTSTPIPTPTATAGITPTAAPTATGTPVATATARPTTTATAAATSTPVATATPNPFLFANCTTSSQLVTDSLLVEAIDLDTAKGRPIIAQVRRSASPSNGGVYTIALPYAPTRTDGSPGTFQIRVSQFDASGARYAGFSAIANFNGATTVTNLNICVNQNGVAPQVPPVTIFTPTPTFSFFPIGTATPTTAPAGGGGTGGP